MNVIYKFKLQSLEIGAFGIALKQLYYKKFGFRLGQENAVTTYIYFA